MAMAMPKMGALLSLAGCLGAAACDSGTAGGPGPALGSVGVPEQDGTASGAEAGGPTTEPDLPSFEPPAIDLLADHNRNGQIDLDLASEDEGEETWTAEAGAIFLANLDDDENACPKEESLTDEALASCFDAADGEVNGAEDLEDMAPLAVRAWPAAPEGATGKLSLAAPGSQYARLFKGSAESYAAFGYGTTSLSTAELRAGTSFLLEGLDIVRDTAAWDGYLDITLTVSDAQGAALGQDTVRMRVSPVMLYHHLLDAETVFFTYFGYAASKLFRDDIVEAIALGGSAAVHQGLVTGDQWTQDFFEPGYMSMPAKGGGQKAIRVNFRSANVSPWDTNNPLRKAGKLVYTVLAGKDYAGITQYDPKGSGDADSLNSFGNTETIPPYDFGGKSFPLGRLFRGSIATFHPDPTFATMLESQAMQPPLYVDTSWLLVGHVDEAFSFIKVASPRGWALVVNDVALAKKMLEEQVAKGQGDAKMFSGMEWDDGKSAEVSIADVLADADVMGESAASAVEVDAWVQLMKDEAGLTDEEIVRVPYLHWKVYGYSVAYQPGTVNGLVLDGKNFLAPDPHGPVIDGKDLMKTQMEEAYAKVGWTVHWVEDWDLYHALLGEVHCGSNATRQIPAAKWWESGR